ncbi:MAG: hypothetical protein JNL35_13140 [Sphingopyxis sp.]|nr:hypothetical protein [Sphingopyxis sp.]
MTGRGTPRTILTWLGFALIGAAVGLFFGHLVLGEQGARGDRLASYADLTGNPHAPGPPPAALEPCYDCAGSYGRGIRHDASDDGRMDDAFRELGAVEIDYGAEPSADYRYGGRFDDPAAAREIAMQSPVPETPPEPPVVMVPAADPPPPVPETPPVPAQ